MSTPPEQWNDLPESDGFTLSENTGVDDTQSVEGTGHPSDIVVRHIEDMTLAEMAGQLWRTPGQTWDALIKVLSTPASNPVNADLQLTGVAVRKPNTTWDSILNPFRTEAVSKLSTEEINARKREGVQLGLRLAALVAAVSGTSILATERIQIFGLDAGAPYLLIAFLIWIGAEIFGAWPSLQNWWITRTHNQLRVQNQVQPEDKQPAEVFFSAESPADEVSRSLWMRLSMVAAGLMLSLLTAMLNANNRFTLLGILVWMASIGVWVAAFAPSVWKLNSLWGWTKQIRFQRSWTFWTLVIILLLAAYFRLYQLGTAPPEMTSDHVEKILDAQQILDGSTQVFFPNNGGREPMQFYMLAFLKSVLGLPLNFLTLKLLTALEGVVSILVLWWMGRELFRAEDQRLGNLLGLILAALVAVSYWHTSLSRLGLRIILTVSFTGLLIVFLSRAMRYNRRGDYIKAGLVLGFGLYAYQAVRMLPVVIVVGLILVVVFRGFATRFGRRGDWQLKRFTAHLAVLVILSLVVFVPMLTFSLQYPNDFWRRTSGRLLGDDLIQTTDAQGNIVDRVATLDERFEAFRQNWPILADNIRNALLMYNWKGDVAWINAAPNRPAMDIFTGALLIIGLAAWMARMIRRRDAVDWLIPIMLFIMLLPSALSIAYPIENPSATRTSGTLPEAYLLAAFPLALICMQIVRIAPRRGFIFAGALAGFFVLSAYNANQTIYFGEYKIYYTGSALPHSDAGKALQGFAESGGSYGNAFLIGYDYWFDHRAVGINAGLLDWPNGIVTREETPRFLFDASQRLDQYRLDPDKDLLFFYSLKDEQTEVQLQTWFPNGYAQVFESYQPEDNFKMYRVPALRNAGLINFFVRNDLGQ